jgi:hypothetical protein
MTRADSPHEWEQFRTFLDKGVAEALAARLESEGVPTHIGHREIAGPQMIPADSG